MYGNEFCGKSFICFFITPKMTTHFTSMDQACWRHCRDDEGNHHHIFGAVRAYNFFVMSPKIILHEETCNIFWGAIPLNCTALYLGDLPEEITQQGRYLLRILVASAKKAIGRKWLQKDPPTVGLKSLKRSMRCKDGPSFYTLQKEIYIVRWTQWLNYL